MAAVLVHVQINYDVATRAIVRSKATIATIVVSFPLALFFIGQMRKNYMLTAELQRLVDRDRLTDVATRDFFFARMQAAPDAYGVSLMVDIDQFKAVNDRHGHLVGDQVIKDVAGILRQNTRADDIVCRFGGEEFVIFLSSQTQAQGFAIAERMRTDIAAHLIETQTGQVRVTVSIGGSLKDRMENVSRAIHDADKALYAAKNRGRNMTIFTPLDPDPPKRRAVR